MTLNITSGSAPEVPVQAVGPPTTGEISRLKPAYFSIYLHIKRKTPENRAYFISIFKIKGTMHGYAFNIGDLLRIKPGTIDYITTPADPDKHYTHSLRVVFRFWDGKQNVYVVTAEDGITMFIIEDNAELQEAAPEEAQAPDTVNSRLLDEETYQALRRLGILDTSVRAYNRGTSDYSRHIIQPWTIWQDYNLNPWDADIVKRILRTKQGDSRRLDYEKIIHICEERIRQIDTAQ